MLSLSAIGNYLVQWNLQCDVNSRLTVVIVLEMSSHDRHFNVGVIGKTGSGKSTLINAFFSLPHTDEYAAATDVVECTKTLTPYSLPENKVILWDVPGFGTQRITDEDYIKTINLKNFDFYLLLSCSKIDEFEILLHNEIAKQGKRYFYIRTKFYQELRNEKRAHRDTFSEEKTRSKIQKEISDMFPDVPIYFVDSLRPDLYDFPNLEQLVKEGARFSVSSHRDVQRKTQMLTQVRSNERNNRNEKCVIL